MNRLLRASSLLAGLVLTLCATVFVAPTSDARQGDALQQKHEALTKEYEEAKTKWRAEYQAADKAKRKELNTKKPAPEYLAKFQALADEAKGTETAPKALITVMNVAMEARRMPEAVAAYDTVLANYLTSPAIDMLPFVAQQIVAPEQYEALLTKLQESSPHKNVKGAAAFMQWQMAQQKISMAGGDPNADAAILEMAKKLAKDYADVKAPFGDQTFGQMAEAFVFVAENLTIGKVAPDQEAIDENGVKFKVSDYRGKVVVLDFWGYW
jgi:rRNA maturation endonuclease Nob1